MVHFYTEKPKKASKKKATLVIQHMDAFGQGISYFNHKIVFVPWALPQEQVEVVWTEEKKNYIRAKMVKRLTTSPSRVIPVCEYYEQCGGCHQQHIALDVQRQSKAEGVLALFEKEVSYQGSFDFQIVGSAYGYRRRTRLSLYYDKPKKQLVLGYRKENSNRIVSLSSCPILCQPLEQLIQPLQHALSTLQTVDKLGHVELIATESGITVLLRHRARLSDADQHILRLFSQTNHASFYLQGNDRELTILAGAQPWYSLGALKYYFNPGDFIQVNAEINQKMVSKAVELLALTEQDIVLDLFCGMGNFSLSIAQKAAKVIGVEGVPSLVEQAKQNAELNHLDNVLFYYQNLEEPFADQIWCKTGFNKVLLDPARAGAEFALRQLMVYSPTHVVYVSCHPATLARDSKVLVSFGYEVDSIGMLDMFPQTQHVEALVLFRKRKLE